MLGSLFLRHSLFSINGLINLASLTADIRSENQCLTGKTELSRGKGNQAEKSKASFSVQEENNEEYEGSLEIAEYSGKIEKSRFAVCLKLEPGYSVIWPDSESYTAVDLNRSEQSEEEKELQEEIIKCIIQRIGLSAKNS